MIDLVAWERLPAFCCVRMAGDQRSVRQSVRLGACVCSTKKCLRRFKQTTTTSREKSDDLDRNWTVDRLGSSASCLCCCRDRAKKNPELASFFCFSTYTKIYIYIFVVYICSAIAYAHALVMHDQLNLYLYIAYISIYICICICVWLCLRPSGFSGGVRLWFLLVYCCCFFNICAAYVFVFVLSFIFLLGAVIKQSRSLTWFWIFVLINWVFDMPEYGEPIFII